MLRGVLARERGPHCCEIDSGEAGGAKAGRTVSSEEDNESNAELMSQVLARQFSLQPLEDRCFIRVFARRAARIESSLPPVERGRDERFRQHPRVPRWGA